MNKSCNNKDKDELASQRRQLTLEELSKVTGGVTLQQKTVSKQ